MNLSGIPGSMAATLPSMVAEDSDQHLTQVFGDLAVQMQAQRGASDTLKSIVEAAAQIVPGARWAGISMIRGKQVVAEVPPAAKSELDQLQSDTGDGPARHGASRTPHRAHRRHRYRYALACLRP